MLTHSRKIKLALVLAAVLVAGLAAPVILGRKPGPVPINIKLVNIVDPEQQRRLAGKPMDYSGNQYRQVHLKINYPTNSAVICSYLGDMEVKIGGNWEPRAKDALMISEVQSVINWKLHDTLVMVSPRDEAMRLQLRYWARPKFRLLDIGSLPNSPSSKWAEHATELVSKRLSRWLWPGIPKRDAPGWQTATIELALPKYDPPPAPYRPGAISEVFNTALPDSTPAQ